MTQGRCAILSRVFHITIFAVLAGCLSPIGIETSDASGRLIITGQVSTIEHRNVVNVHSTAGTTRQAFTVSGAVARIVDDLGNVWTCVEEKPGTYKAVGLIGVPGRTYHAEVGIPETDDEYRSQPERLPMVIGEDEVYYDFTREEFIDSEGTPSQQPFINFHSVVNIQEPSEPYYFKWTVNEIYAVVPTDFPDPFGSSPPPCFISKTTDPQRVVLFDGTRQQSLKGDFLVAARVAENRAFHSKYSGYIYRSSITFSAYDYWRKVNVLVNQVGSIFDTPPAEINGNVFNINDPTEKVYGFFQACNETYKRITVRAAEVPLANLPYCEYNSARLPNEYPSECLNCGNAVNSSPIEPELFKGG
jgi:hypothetical protein